MEESKIKERKKLIYDVVAKFNSYCDKTQEEYHNNNIYYNENGLQVVVIEPVYYAIDNDKNVMVCLNCSNCVQRKIDNEISPFEVVLDTFGFDIQSKEEVFYYLQFLRFKEHINKLIKIVRNSRKTFKNLSFNLLQQTEVKLINPK